jgi:hypothetical protein
MTAASIVISISHLLTGIPDVSGKGIYQPVPEFIVQIVAFL